MLIYVSVENQLFDGQDFATPGDAYTWALRQAIRQIHLSGMHSLDDATQAILSHMPTEIAFRVDWTDADGWAQCQRGVARGTPGEVSDAT